MIAKDLQDALYQIVGEKTDIWTTLQNAYDKGVKDTLDALGKSGTLSWGQVARFMAEK